jgi:hypothetical protein
LIFNNTKRNLETGNEKIFNVEYDDGSYSPDGKYYLMTYVSDDKHHQDPDEIGRFVIQYNVKKTAVLAVRVKINDMVADAFLTEKGNEVLPQIK